MAPFTWQLVNGRYCGEDPAGYVLYYDEQASPAQPISLPLTTALPKP